VKYVSEFGRVIPDQEEIPYDSFYVILADLSKDVNTADDFKNSLAKYVVKEEKAIKVRIFLFDLCIFFF